MQLIDMKCVRVHEDPLVHLVKVPFANFNWSATNCFVIQSEGETLIVDTGAPTDDAYRALSGALADLEIDLGKTSFLLTHFHVDHSGLIDRVAPPLCPVYVSAVDHAYIDQEGTGSFAHACAERIEQEGCDREEALMYGRMHGGNPEFDPQAHRICPVGDRDTIRVGSLDLEVWICPGHTPGHLVLLEPHARIMFCGDHFLRVVTPSIDLMPDRSDSFEEYLRGLKRMKQASPAFLFQGHGALQHEYRDRIDWLVEHHRQRLRITLDAAAEHPDLTGAQLIRSMGWNVPFESWEQITIMQRAIIIGEGAVILDHLVGTGTLVRTLDDRGIRRYHIDTAHTV